MIPLYLQGPVAQSYPNYLYIHKLIKNMTLLIELIDVNFSPISLMRLCPVLTQKCFMLVG